MRGQTDGSGSLTGTADYDVFGAARGTSTLTGPFGFTGEQHDSATGLTYLRARSYQPTTGRFLSADTVQPNAPGTQGYNRYTYTANNPSTWTDPSGHTIDDAMQQMGAIDLIIGAIVSLDMLVVSLIPAMLAMPMLQLALGIFFFVAFMTLAMLLLKVIGDVLMLLQDAFDHYAEGAPTEDPPSQEPEELPEEPDDECDVNASEGAITSSFSAFFTGGSWTDMELAWTLIGCAAEAWQQTGGASQATSSVDIDISDIVREIFEFGHGALCAFDCAVSFMRDLIPPSLGEVAVLSLTIGATMCFYGRDLRACIGVAAIATFFAVVCVICASTECRNEFE